MPEAVDDASSARARSCATRVLVFCAGSGGTGRTTLAAALAVAAIECGLRVRLVDADRATAGLTQLVATDDAELGAALLAQDEFELAVGQAGAALDEAVPGVHAPSRRARALRSLLLAVSEGGVHDLVLVDAPSGTGMDGVALSGAADGWILVVDPSPAGRVQARRFLAATQAVASGAPRRPSWCGVIANRAPAELDGSDLAGLARELGPAVHSIARVGLEAIAPPDVRWHVSVRADHAATRFADDALRAFDVLLTDEQARWPEEVRDRWRALVAGKARDIARAEARQDLEASVERKRLDRWPRLEEEHERLAAELDRLRGLQTEELLRHAAQLDDLRMQVLALRSSLDTARSRESVRRTRALAAVGLGFVGGALLVLAGAVSIGHVPGLVH